MDEVKAVAPKSSSLALTLTVLVIVYLFNFLDRQIVAILAEPIAKDLDLSDTEIGLLTGLAFALFYTFLGIPIASFADKPKTDRVWVISAAVAIWSLMTVISGFTQNFVQLLLARVGVGVGEAGCTPPAHSLITDKAPPEKRATAFSIYQIGVPIGGLIGMAMGGFLAETVGWRMAFVLVGAPGLLLALITRLLLKDPRFDVVTAEIAQHRADLAAKGATVKEAMGYIFASKSMRFILIGGAFGAFAGFGILIWATIFYQRIHGLSVGETGLWFGVVNGVASALGIWIGGMLADYFGSRQRKYILLLPALAVALQVPFNLLAFTVGSWQLSLVLIFPAILLNYMYVAPILSSAHGLVPPTARAMASALILFVQNLVGLGFGPLVMGWFSDELAPVYGTESVRIVLIAASLLVLAGAFFFWLASRHLDDELHKYG